MSDTPAPKIDFRQASYGISNISLNGVPQLGAPYYINPQLHIHHLTRENERLHRLAFLDALTEIPNRNALHEHLGSQENLPDHPQRRHVPATSVVFIDLDGFKKINDTHGHEAGDNALKAVAHAMRFAIREDDHIFRLGGDEFVLLLNEASVQDANLTVARRIESLLDKGIAFEIPGGSTGHVHGSLGVFPVDSTISLKDNIARADAVMYETKQQRKLSAQRHAETSVMPPAPAPFSPPPAP